MLCEQPKRHRIELGVPLTAFSPRAGRALGIAAIGFDLSRSHGFGASHLAVSLCQCVHPYRNTNVKIRRFEGAS